MDKKFAGCLAGTVFLGCAALSSAAAPACAPDNRTCGAGADEVSALQVLVAVNQAGTSARAEAGVVTPLCSDGRACPHIFMVLGDDLGWWNVPWHNPDMQPFMPTSMELVRQGIELDRHYGYWACAPSRASLLSGRFPLHVMDQDLDSADDANFGIPIAMTAFPQKLKEVGYATHIVGKWHAGHASTKQLPQARGFDTFLGYFDGAEDHFTQAARGYANVTDLWEHNATYSGPAYQRAGSAYGDLQFSQHVVQTLQRHPVEQPIFFYVSFQNPHSPFQVPSQMLEGLPNDWTETRQIYAGMVRYLDLAMHNVVEALKLRNMWQHTLFVFISDNGAPKTGNNWPLVGRKTEPFEGGIRLASFISGGFLPPSVRGTKQEGYAHLADWYATFCDLAGADLSDAAAASEGLPPLDSLSLWPLISGAAAESPRQEMPIAISELPEQVFISGRYKFISGGHLSQGQWAPDCPTLTTPCPSSVSVACEDGCVYDILADPSESFELSEELPAVKVQLLERMAELRKGMLHVSPAPNAQLAMSAWLKLYNGFLGPWLDLDA